MRCRSKHISACVYEAAVSGSRNQQLRKDIQNLKEEVAVLNTSLREFQAEMHPSKRKKEDHSPSLKQEINASGYTAHSKVDPDSQLQQIRDEDEGKMLVSKVTDYYHA